MAKETPEERLAKQRKNMEKARKALKENQEKRRAGIYVPPPKKKRPRNLDKIVREILDDDELIDKVVANQPEFWNRLPTKNGGHVIATVMMVKAMGGDIKAAEWIRKTGFGDKVMLESDDGFFQKTEFNIQVVPAKSLDDGISSQDVLEGEIKQVDE